MEIHHLVLQTLGVISLFSFSCSIVIPKNYPSNLMFDYNWPEPDFRIKKYPHEKYCHYFYNWESEDMYTIRKCPKGEMFDYHSHECKEKKSAQCWSHHFGKDSVHDHIQSKWRKNFKCPYSTGKYPDIFDCEKYFVCIDGQVKHKHCSPEKLFDKIRRHCVNENVAQCADVEDDADVNYRCPSPSGYFGHPKDCSKYYKCHNSIPSFEVCDKNKLFDEMDMLCQDKENVQCGHRHNPYSFENLLDTTLLPRDVVSKETEFQFETSNLFEAHQEINDSSVSEINKTLNNTGSLVTSITQILSSEHSKTTKFIDEQTIQEKTSREMNTIPIMNLSQTNSTILTAMLDHVAGAELEPNSTITSSEDHSSNATVACLSDGSTCITEKDGSITRCPTENGAHPYPGDNTRFLQCENFKIHIRICPHSQVFDSNQNVCVRQIS